MSDEMRVDRGVFLERIILGYEGHDNALCVVYELKCELRFGGSVLVLFGVDGVILKDVLCSLGGLGGV